MVLGYDYIGIQFMMQKVFLLISFPVKLQVCKVWLQTLGSLTILSEELYY